MSFVIDGLLIIICLIVFATSVKRGFVKTILSIVSTVAAALMAVAFTPSLSSFLYEKFMLNRVVAGIENTVASYAGSGTAEEIANMFRNMSDSFGELLARYGITEEAVADMTEKAISGNSTVQSIAESIASPVANTFAAIIAFILIFAVAKILLGIVVFVVDKVSKLPVLNAVNKLAGFILGLVLVCVTIFIYSAVADSFITSLGSISPKLFGADVVDNTIIVKFFSEHNIFGIIKDIL